MRNQILFLMFLTAISFAVLVSCSNPYAEAEMSRAEAYMESHPDSALAVLQSIHADDLLTPSDRALYGLLYTQALDKNWLEPKNDSLISLAVAHYMSVDNPSRLAVAYYYQGMVRCNNENYPSAIVCYFKAKELAESQGLYFYAGMACRGISDIYNQSYNSAEELHFAEKEYDYFHKFGKQPFLNYALLDLGRALYNKGNYEKTLIVSNQLLDSANIHNDETLRQGSLRLTAQSLISMEKYNEAVPLLSEICESQSAEPIDSLRLCEAMIETGQMENASNLLAKTSDIEIPLKNSIEYKINKKYKNYREALHNLEHIDSVTNQLFRNSVSHNLTTSLTDYFNIKRAEDELKIKEERIFRNLSILCAFIAIMLIVLLSLHYYRRQSKKISEKVLLAEQLAESLKKSKSENSINREVLKWLKSSKYELLENLCSIVYSYGDESKRREKVADAVDKVISDLSTRSDKINEWEKQVDSLYDNLFSDFRNDFPNLKDIDYRLFLFLVIGLEIPTITLLLRENKVDAVYNRKRRLKNKISNLDNERKAKYLSFL